MQYANALGHQGNNDAAPDAMQNALRANSHMTREHCVSYVRKVTKNTAVIDRRIKGLEMTAG